MFSTVLKEKILTGSAVIDRKSSKGFTMFIKKTTYRSLKTYIKLIYRNCHYKYANTRVYKCKFLEKSVTAAILDLNRKWIIF